MYFVIEGPDGTGKSTVSHAVGFILHTLGIPCHCTREPGGTPEAEALREFVTRTKGLDNETKLLCMYASRQLSLTQLVKPLMDEGKVVISDRNYMSSIVYQCPDLSTQAKEVILRDTFLKHLPQPELILVLMAPAEELMRRKAEDGDYNELDPTSIEACEVICDKYSQTADKLDNAVVIDATRDRNAVIRSVLDQVLPRMGKGKTWLMERLTALNTNLETMIETYLAREDEAAAAIARQLERRKAEQQPVRGLRRTMTTG